MKKSMNDGKYHDARDTIVFAGIIVVISLLFVLLSGAAAAQEASSTYSRAHSKYYIGFGLGGGAGVESHSGSPLSELSGGFSFAFRLGRILSPNLLFGADGVAWGCTVDTGSGERMFMYYHADLMLTAYPLDDLGLYFKGGFGLADRTIYDQDRDRVFEETGLSARAAAGYEFQLGQAFNMGLEVSVAVSLMPSGFTEDLLSLINFNWY